MLTVRRGEAGIGLIELLVAIVIATFGLLALAALQAAGARYAKMSQYRAIATLLADDLTERLRANRTGTYDFQQAFSAQAVAPALAAGAPTCDTAQSNCTSAEMAAADLYTWRKTVRAQLPQGSAFLLPDAAPAIGLSLWIAWRDPAVQSSVTADQQGSAECPTGLSVSTDLAVRCLFFRVQP